MSIEFICQVCGRELKADERAIGRKVRCPDCATLLVIPDPAAVEEQEQPAEPVAEAREVESIRREERAEVDLGETAPMDVNDFRSPDPQPTPQQPRRKKKRRED